MPVDVFTPDAHLMSTPSLHPRIAEVIDALVQAQRELETTLAQVPAGREQEQPAGQGWSVALIMEHLALIEDGAGRLLSNLIKQSGDAVETDDSPIAPTIERFQVWNPRTRIEAPDMVQPRGIVNFADAVAQQAASRARLIAVLEQASGRALATVSYPHPILGPLNGYQWALVTAQHQRRHIVQMAAVSSSLAS
jgi:hypothetical protein